MARLVAVFLFVGLILSGTAYGMPKGVGLGVIVGEPTGFVIKKWLDEETAVDGAVAWSLGDNDSLHLHADYLLHNYTLLHVQEVKGTLPVYLGVGGRVKFEDDKNGNDDTRVGIRFPFGLTYLPEGSPLDFFAEFVPIIDVAPDTDLKINAAIGFRYYFR